MGGISLYERERRAEEARAKQARRAQEDRMKAEALILYNRLIGQPDGVRERFITAITGKIESLEVQPRLTHSTDMVKVLATLCSNPGDGGDWHFYGHYVLKRECINYKILDRKKPPSNEELKFILRCHYRPFSSRDKNEPTLLDFAMQYVPINERSRKLSTVITYPISYDEPVGAELVKHWPEIVNAENIALAFQAIESIGNVVPTIRDEKGRKPFNARENTLRSWCHFIYACAHLEPELLSDNQFYRFVELSEFWPHYNILSSQSAGLGELVSGKQGYCTAPIKPRFTNLDWDRIGRVFFETMAKADRWSNDFNDGSTFLLNHFGGTRHAIFSAALPCAATHSIFIGTRISKIVCEHPEILRAEDWDGLKAHLLERDEIFPSFDKPPALVAIAKSAKENPRLQYPFDTEFMLQMLNAHAFIPRPKYGIGGGAGAAYEAAIAISAADYSDALAMREVGYMLDQAYGDLMNAGSSEYSQYKGLQDYYRKGAQRHLTVLNEAIANNARLAEDAVEDFTVKFDQGIEVIGSLMRGGSRSEIVGSSSWEARKAREESFLRMLKTNVLLLTVPEFGNALAVSDFFAPSRIHGLCTLIERPLPESYNAFLCQESQDILRLTAAALQQINPPVFESNLPARVMPPSVMGKFRELLDGAKPILTLAPA